jgi:iron(III) transport system substrate-binding protein
MKITKGFSTLCIGLACLLAPGAAKAASPQEIAAAKKEGKIVLYTTIDLDEMAKFREAFNKRYPDIKLDVFEASGYKVFEKLMTEIDANRVGADVLSVADVVPLMILKEKGELLKHESPELKYFPDYLKDPGYWVGIMNYYMIMLYNADKVKDSNAITSYKDLLNPKWKGKIAISDMRTSTSGYAWLYAVRSVMGKEFVDGMGKQNMLLVRGHSGIRKKIMSGEKWIAPEMREKDLWSATKKKAPVRGVWPTEGVPPIIYGTGIIKRAPHPNAAKVFLDWILSKEGQKVGAKIRGTGRIDVKPPKGRERPGSFKVIKVDYKKQEDDHDMVVKEWAKAFGVE